MDVHDKLAELRRTVADARSTRMSGSAVVNRAELLQAIDELGGELEKSVAESRRVVDERTAVVAEGQREADRIIADAHHEREKMISDTDVFRVAKRQAEGLLAQARTDAEALRHESDTYVDAKLANFEVTLARTTESVKRGRARLAGRSDFADLGPDETDSAPHDWS